MNKFTWDNPVLMGPAMAERHGDRKPKTWSRSN